MLKDYKKLNHEIVDWIKFSMKDDDSWHLKDMHIDQFFLFTKLKREFWIEKSFELFEYIDNRVFEYKPLRLCLHIALTFSETEKQLNTLDLNYLNTNIHQLTPPSFMFIEQQYLSQYYKVKFNKISISENIQSLNEEVSTLEFYYQSFYDKDEKLYVRSIYVVK